MAQRLHALVGDVPLLTRARDSDGERDNNLLAQMRVLAGGDARADQEVPRDGEPTLAQAAALREAWQLRRHRTSLNLELSAAVDRLEQWCAVLPPGGVAPLALASVA